MNGATGLLPARALLARLLPESPAERALSLATLANTVGDGMFYTVSAIYFTQSVGLSPAQVGLGLTLAGLCGLLAGVPAGQLGDVRGPRDLLIALAAAEGVGVLAYTLVDSFLGFLLAACSCASRGGSRAGCWWERCSRPRASRSRPWWRGPSAPAGRSTPLPEPGS